MSKIISILPQIGLFQWIDDDGKHCQPYSNMMIIERDNGSIELHPIAALGNIDGDTVDGIVKWHNDEKVQMVDLVNTDLFNTYVKSEIDFELENCAWAIAHVVKNLKESKVDLKDEVIEPLRELKKQLKELFKEE